MPVVIAPAGYEAGVAVAAGEGMITYMRTDGLQMSAEAVEEMRATVQALLGPRYLPKAPRAYKCAHACSNLP